VLSSNQGQRIRVSQIMIHPAYTSQNDPPHGDVALLRLAEPVTLTGTINSAGAVGLIQLAGPIEPALVGEGTLAVVTGWGDRSNGQANYADALHQVTVPLVSNATCRAAYDPLGYGPITDGILCAGFVEGGKDACYGDSGGPLVVRTGVDRWKQVGIVSSGLECAVAGQYGTYARVPYYTDWIFGAGTNTYVSAAFTVRDDAGHMAVIANATAITVVQPLQKSYLPLIGN
jgi:secreted trypsin-like serine protease